MASDYIFIRKSRNIVSDILHVALNLLLGVGSIFFTVVSGSWIIQDGKLVGAVTHVLVNDPQTGYGIFIENMLEAAS